MNAFRGFPEDGARHSVSLGLGRDEKCLNGYWEVKFLQYSRWHLNWVYQRSGANVVLNYLPTRRDIRLQTLFPKTI